MEAIPLKRHRIIFAMLFGLTMAFSGSVRAQPQTRPGTVIQETDDEVKVAVYRRFVDNRVPNPALAYEAAREYLRRYVKENDEYTKYLKDWTLAYEKDDRQQKLLQSIYGDKNFAAGYGLAKQVLADSPDDLRVLIALGYGGYLATTTAKNETFNSDSVRYAQRAIQLLESGRTPDEWKPFQSKDDVLASLHGAIAFLDLKTKPEDSIVHFIKALQYESELKKAPKTYYYLAVALQTGPYRRLSEDYRVRFADKPETPESKVALENINKSIDRIIDAYARAVALAGNDAQLQTAKAEWMQPLTQFYKFRHADSDAGLSEFIAGVLSRPIPQS
jgi:hypothetical protein